MSKSIKELADELGVSKSSLRHKIESLKLQPVLKKVGNQFTINNEQEKVIREAFKIGEEIDKIESPHEKIQKDDRDDILYDMLQQELKIKDKQINELNKQIQGLMTQNTQLIMALQNTTDSLKSAQALHAGTIKQQLTQKSELNDIKEDTKNKWKFWSKFPIKSVKRGKYDT